jgi:hypothetical protein
MKSFVFKTLVVYELEKLRHRRWKRCVLLPLSNSSARLLLIALQWELKESDGPSKFRVIEDLMSHGAVQVATSNATTKKQAAVGRRLVVQLSFA